jgi:hypothetical protein
LHHEVAVLLPDHFPGYAIVTAHHEPFSNGTDSCNIAPIQGAVQVSFCRVEVLSAG